MIGKPVSKEIAFSREQTCSRRLSNDFGKNIAVKNIQHPAFDKKITGNASLPAGFWYRLTVSIKFNDYIYAIKSALRIVMVMYRTIDLSIFFENSKANYANTFFRSDERSLV